MNNKTQSRVEHFATLKSKYQATPYKDSCPSSVLYLILRKADLGIEITEIERNWLKSNELFETIESIENDQQFKAKELVDLGIKFSNLKSQYKAKNYHTAFPSLVRYSNSNE